MGKTSRNWTLSLNPNDPKTSLQYPAGFLYRAAFHYRDKIPEIGPARQQVRTLAAMPDDLSSIPRTHMEKEKKLSKLFF